jgi:hypothetical protein
VLPLLDVLQDMATFGYSDGSGRDQTTLPVQL